MATAKIAITLDANVIKKLDFLVKSKFFKNRSRVIQEAVSEKLMRLEKSRLAQECAKLNADFEQDLAEEGMPSEIKEWPKY